MTWCEGNRVGYVFGLARNERLVGAIADELAAAESESLASCRPVRRFVDFAWRTLHSWSRDRRVVAKAEHLPKGSNPRFVVTSLAADEIDARTLYEDVYCARGQVENRIKEQQFDLFADRTSAATLRANQLRLWFASFAYVLLDALRRIGLRHTQFASATCGTIRLKLLRSAPRCAGACAGSRSPWPRPALTRTSSTSPSSTCEAPSPSERSAYRPPPAGPGPSARPQSGSAAVVDHSFRRRDRRPCGAVGHSVATACEKSGLEHH